MRKLYVDWSHDQSKFVVRENGKVIKIKLSEIIENADSEIYVENIPIKYANLLLQAGIRIFRCRPNDVSELREKRGLEKTDQIDCALIEELGTIAPHVFREYFGQPRLLNLYKQFERIQDTRIAIGNQAWSNDDAYAKILVESLEKLEKDLEKGMIEELNKFPIYTEFLTHIKGLGPRLCGPLVGIIENIGIKNFNYPSQLRKYAGLAVEDGRSDRHIKGKASNYNETAKTVLLGRIGKSFIMQKTPFYRDIYEQEKEFLKNKTFAPGYLSEKYGKDRYKNWIYKPEYTSYLDRKSGGPGHIDKMARRKAVQIFLNHVWVLWRQLEGFETKNDYQFDKLGHSTYLAPPIIPQSLQPFNPVKAGVSTSTVRVVHRESQYIHQERTNFFDSIFVE